MQAWLLESFSGLSALRLATVPDPRPGEDEVVLEIEFAALNPADRFLAEAQYPAKPALPHILGRDGVGIVRETGRGVHGVRIGDRRLVLRREIGVTRPGTFAEYVAVPIESLVEVPSGWSEAEAAGGPLVYLTAYQALTQWGDLPPSLVLVTGASGGVGVASIHIATALGHTVIALSRDPVKAQRLREMGAAFVFDPHDPDWTSKLKQQLAGRRVDLAIDNIGGDLLPRVIDTLGDHGKVSLVGRLAGPVPQFNTAALFFRRLRLGGVAVGAYTPQESRSAWSAIVSLLERRGVKPVVDSIFPFAQLLQAFARLAHGPIGKVLLQVEGGKR